MTAAKTYPTEHAEQVAFVQWFRREYPGVLIFAIPNGGLRTKAGAEKLKMEGVTPGIPDLMVPEWSAFIEMKRVKGGSVSKEQRETLAYLEQCGYQTAVCKGALEAMEFCRSIAKDN